MTLVTVLHCRTKCDVADGQYVQLMVWAPVGHAFAFVRDNDVFYQSVHCPAPNAQRITNSPDYVFNGIADWVYEGNCHFLLLDGFMRVTWYFVCINN